jgi:hypothetical protein
MGAIALILEDQLDIAELLAVNIQRAVLHPAAGARRRCPKRAVGRCLTTSNDAAAR